MFMLQCITSRSLSRTQEGKQTHGSGHDHGGSARAHTLKEKEPTNGQQLTAAGARQDLTASDMETLRTQSTHSLFSSIFFFFFNIYNHTASLGQRLCCQEGEANVLSSSSPSWSSPCSRLHLFIFSLILMNVFLDFHGSCLLQ